MTFLSDASGSSRGRRAPTVKVNSFLYRNLYMGLSRLYVRCVLGDRPADLIVQRLGALHFWRAHGYFPNFKYPQTFSEKIWHRMLFKRDPQLAILSDKLFVRNHIAKSVGEEHLVPLLWTGTDPDLIPVDDLPDRFVVKATHGSGFNIIVTDKGRWDAEHAKSQLRSWLGRNYCNDRFLGLEWGYRHACPRIVIEHFLEENGKSPVDYKFFCFGGRAQFVQADCDRFGNHTRTLCNRDFQPLPLQLGSCKQHAGKIERPVNYDGLIQVAEALSRNLDFVRVDLYSTGEQIYVGELTMYPGAGSERFNPRQYDLIFGQQWQQWQFATPVFDDVLAIPLGRAVNE